MDQANGNGLAHLRSRSDFETTAMRLTHALQQHNLTLISVIDHSLNARSIGLVMSPTKLFIFGNPLSGTPVMLSTPSAAIDLPLKVLIQEKGDEVWISYNTPEYLQLRHGFPQNLTANFRGLRTVCEDAAA